MSNSVENNKITSDDLLRKISNNLDIWRGILYSIILGDITINNFEFLCGYISNYIILLFACLLIILDPINRYLYRDFTIRKIEDNTKLQSELWFIFAIFGIEIAALFSLCFGVKGLGKLDHQKYLLLCFLCNFGLNLAEFWAIFKQLRKVDNKFNLRKAIKKVFKGETEFFFFGNNDKQFKGWSFFSEQYLAFNTLIFSGWLFILLLSYDFWHTHFPTSPLLIFILLLVKIFDSTFSGVRSIKSNILLFISFLFLFISCAALFDRKGFIICCLLHYVLVSFCYLRLYIVELLDFIPKLKEKQSINGNS